MNLGDIPIMLIRDGVIIRALPTHLRAEFGKPIGDYHVPEMREKYFPDVDDLYALPLRGLAKLSMEFYNELKNN